MLDFQPRRCSSPLGWSLLAGGVVLALTCIVIQHQVSKRPINSKVICKPRNGSSPATPAPRPT